jgi:hypothetical protein
MEHPGIALALPRVMAERLERANHSIGIDFVNLSRLKIDPRVLTPAFRPCPASGGRRSSSASSTRATRSSASTS